MRRLDEVDLLRGIAAFIVLLSHIPHHAAVQRMDLRFLLCLPLDFGYLGVQLFLLISGFCIHLRCAEEVAAGPTVRVHWVSFWKRRFWRLYPPFLVAMVLSIVVWHVANRELYHPLHRADALLLGILVNALMIQNVLRFPVGNHVFWSLGLEEQLYALYRPLLALRRRMGMTRVLCAVAAICLVWHIASYTVKQCGLLADPGGPSRWDSLQSWPFAFWYMWALGALAAEIHTGAFIAPRWFFDVKKVPLLMGLGLLVHEKTLGRALGSNFALRHLGSSVTGAMGYLTLAAEPAMVLGLFILMNWLIRRGKRFSGSERPTLFERGFTRLGLFSYSLYLVHVPVIYLGLTVLGADASVPGTVLRYFALVPCSILFALVFYWLIERRFLLRARQRPAPSLVRPVVAGRSPALVDDARPA